jgi:H+-transporting ATPase
MSGKSEEEVKFEQEHPHLFKMYTNKADKMEKIPLVQAVVNNSTAKPDDVNVEVKEIDDDEVSPDFVYNFNGFFSAEAAERLARFGRNELPENNVPKWYIFCSQLWQPMPIMIWLAIIIEAAIGNYIDMAILVIIQFGNATVAFTEIVKAGDAVAALKSSLKPHAMVLRDGKWQTIDAGEVVPGDCVKLAAGSAVPADSRVNEGQIDVDQSQLTGESLPVTMYKGDSCKMGSIVVRGEVDGTVEYTGSNTFFGKTAALLGNNGEISNLQRTIIRIVIMLVVVSISLCTIVFCYLYLYAEAELVESLSFAVVLLVASIPLAIEIVTTTTLALGSKELTARGAIVSRLVRASTCILVTCYL